MKARMFVTQIVWMWLGALITLTGASWTMSDTGGGLVAMLSLFIGGFSMGAQAMWLAAFFGGGTR